MLEFIHTNIFGPTRIIILNGDNYFMLLIYDYSRMTWVTFLREKFQALDKFKVFKAMVENEVNLKIICLRSDRGGDLTSSNFNVLFEECGIKRQISTSITPQ
jgi:hypothetical protein